MGKIGVDVVGALLAAGLFALLPRFTPLPAEWVLPAVVALVVLVAIRFTVGSRWRIRVRRAAAVVGALVALVSSLVWWNAGAASRMVEEYADGVCGDGMWVDGSVACHEQTVEHIVESFDAYDPGTWHGWEELSGSRAEPITLLAPDGPSLAGQPITTLGVVVGVPQNLGGTLLLQLRPLREREVATVDHAAVASLGGSPEAAEVLLSGTIRDDERPVALVYCNIPPRPFFQGASGRVVAVRGSILASGRTMDQVDGTPLTASYLMCSSLEVVGQS